MTEEMTPRQTDEKLAEFYHALYRAQDRFASTNISLLHAAGAKFSYQRRGRGHVRVADMKVTEALEIVQALAEYVATYEAEHGYTEARDYGEYHGTNWDAWSPPYSLAVHEHDNPARVLAQRAEYQAEIARLNGEIDDLEATYTGWSRFFLVTSSAGHIHSSMNCSTCYPTTRYGWLPEFSGRTEEEAVAELGPTLCSVCFKSAPLDWTEGKKLTKAQAAKLAA